MISSFGDRFPLAPSNRSGGNVQTDTRATSSSMRSHLFSKDERKPPCHLAPTADLGSMFDLGRALGYQKFEIVSLAGRDDGGIVAAHEQAEARNRETESSSWMRQTASAMETPGYDQPNTLNITRDELQREVSCPSRATYHSKLLPQDVDFCRYFKTLMVEHFSYSCTVLRGPI